MFRFLLIGIFIGVVIALLLRRRNPPTPMVEEIHPIGSGGESKNVLPAGDETRASQRDTTGERTDG